MTTKQTKAQTQAPAASKKDFIVVNFLDLDTDKITFLTSKPNTHGGHYVSIRYDNKKLYVRYGELLSPFGISASTEKTEHKGKYKDDQKITGYSIGLSCNTDYASDPYYQKALELDKFFMKKCHENAMAWHIGGSKQKPLSMDVIEGCDDNGADGKWRRILKWSSKKDTEGVRQYLDYPPRMDFGVPTTPITERPGDDGYIVQETTFKPTFTDAVGNAVGPVTTENYTTVLPKFSRVRVLAEWTTITQGVYGACIKPKVVQFRVYPTEAFPRDACMLGDSDDDGEGGSEHYDIGDGFAEDVVVKPVVRLQKTVPPKLVEEEQAEEDGQEQDEQEEEQEQEQEEQEQEQEQEEEQEEEEVAPPPPKPTTHVMRRVTPAARK